MLPAADAALIDAIRYFLRCRCLLMPDFFAMMMLRA